MEYTPRYLSLKKKLIELAKRDREVTAESFSEYLKENNDPLGTSSTRDWLKRFETDGVVKLVDRTKFGKVYRLTT